jgi:hypothetical protein
MPPAFNLSQDQTLQFNLCLVLRLHPASQSKRGITKTKYCVY